MKRLFLLIFALALAGCASLKDEFSTRIGNTVDCQSGSITSWYGPIGLTTKLDPKDLAELPCNNQWRK